MNITEEQASHWTMKLNGRKREVSLVYCCQCGAVRVPLLSREGKRVCKPCYEKVLRYRAAMAQKEASETKEEKNV